MLVYLGLILIELLLCLAYNGAKSEKAKKGYYILGCLLLLLVVGLRSERTGNDTIGYVNRFLSINEVGWGNIYKEFHKDQGYYIFVKLIRTVTDLPVVFLLVTAFMSLIGIFDLIWRNAKQPILALCYYILLGNFLFILTGIRQSIAMSICMLSMRYIQKKSFIKFLLLILLAAQFHHSAYIFIVMYFLGRQKANGINLLLNILGTIVAYFSYESLLEIANDILDYDYGVEVAGNGFIFYIILLTIITLAWLTKKYWIEGNNETVIMNTGVMCGMLWTFRLIGRTAERPSMYWLNAIPVLLTNSIFAIRRKEDKVILIAGSLGLALLLFARRAGGIPYSFIWQ